MSLCALQIFKMTATPIAQTLSFKFWQHLGTRAIKYSNYIAGDAGFQHQEVIEG